MTQLSSGKRKKSLLSKKISFIGSATVEQCSCNVSLSIFSRRTFEDFLCSKSEKQMKWKDLENRLKVESLNDSRHLSSSSQYIQRQITITKVCRISQVVHYFAFLNQNKYKLFILEGFVTFENSEIFFLNSLAYFFRSKYQRKIAFYLFFYMP